jgi:leader peptidase (prepilin peptidase)/N-methyltransferase
MLHEVAGDNFGGGLPDPATVGSMTAPFGTPPSAVLEHRGAGRPRIARLAWQLPMTLVLVVIALVAIGLRHELVGVLYLAAVTPELCRVDVVERRLPNALVLPGFAFAAVGLIFGCLAAGRLPTLPVAVSLAVGGFFLLLAVAGGMGMGDVKLAAVLALAASAVSVLLVIGTVIVAFLVAGVAALVLLAARDGTAGIPFGPYLLGGFWTSIAGAGLA